MALILGLGGSYCAGKSRLSEALQSLGARQIDVDKLGHQALQDQAYRITREFGSNERASLAKQVFSDPKKLALLESIVHPHMVVMVKEMIKKLSAEAVVDHGAAWQQVIIVNAAILLKMHLDQVCDKVVIIDAPWLLRLYRGLKRDKKGLFATIQRMKQQRGLFAQQAKHCADIHRVSSHNTKGFLKQLAKIVGLATDKRA